MTPEQARNEAFKLLSKCHVNGTDSLGRRYSNFDFHLAWDAVAKAFEKMNSKSEVRPLA